MCDNICCYADDVRHSASAMANSRFRKPNTMPAALNVSMLQLKAVKTGSFRKIKT